MAPRGWEHASQAQREALAAHLQHAAELGAEVLQQQCDLVTELTRVACQRNVTQLMLANPAGSCWHELRQGSVVHKLLRAVPAFDVHVVGSG